MSKSYSSTYLNDNLISVSASFGQPEKTEVFHIIRMNGIWALHTVENGVVSDEPVTKDQYRHDLIERIECGHYDKHINLPVVEDPFDEFSVLDTIKQD